MSNVTLNFSTEWSSIQVAKVIANPASAGEEAAYPYSRKIEHGLDYPPLVIGMGTDSDEESYNIMTGLDVDDTYVYIDADPYPGYPQLECAVVCAININNEFSYEQYDSKIGTVLEDTSGGTLDLRNFLLHSRAVSPMVLAVVNKDYTLTDLTLTYTSPLSYPTFSFGYLRLCYTGGGYTSGIWIYAPLSSQAFPYMPTTGYVSTLSSTTIGGNLVADKGSIITLRNPEIITENSVDVTV